MEENEFQDDINIQMLLKLFKAFPLFFKNVIYFIENQKQIKKKAMKKSITSKK